MTEAYFKKSALYFIVAVSLYAAIHLVWQYFNGGVVSHHLLARADMPAVSNWWGIVILPMLAWFATTRMKLRIEFSDMPASIVTFPKHIVIGFIGILSLSLIQSLAFKLGQPNITMYLALMMLTAGLFLPIYRAECFLAHVMGGSIAFGSVIPLIGFTVMALISVVANLGVKPLLIKLITRIKSHHK